MLEGQGVSLWRDKHINFVVRDVLNRVALYFLP